jgi:hypothetical protein
MSSENIGTVSAIRANLEAGVKSYCIYDASRRITHLYEATANCEHGDKCLLTRFKYVGDTSDILSTIETVVEWDSAWDFDNL